MMLDGQRAELQIDGDLGIGLAAAHALQHLALARGQARRHDVRLCPRPLAEEGQVQVGQQQLGQVVLPRAREARHAQEDEQTRGRRRRLIDPMDQHAPPRQAEPGTVRRSVWPRMGAWPPPLRLPEPAQPGPGLIGGCPEGGLERRRKHRPGEDLHAPFLPHRGATMQADEGLVGQKTLQGTLHPEIELVGPPHPDGPLQGVLEALQVVRVEGRHVHPAYLPGA